VKLIAQQKEEWRRIFALNYALIIKDHIGRLWLGSSPDAVPGVWGHSFVRTFYEWVGVTPNSGVQREGGITSTFFVLRSLNAYLNRFHRHLPRQLVNELAQFFAMRTTPRGIGIESVDARGNRGVDPNLRHTCFGYMAMNELVSAGADNSELDRALRTAGDYLLQPFSSEQLLDLWLNDSWPLGGIASYIAARDKLLSAPDCQPDLREALRVWPGVRTRLVQGIIEIKSTDVFRWRAKHRGDGEEHYPFWHPIYGRPVLRLHSLNGCLSLVGRYIAAEPSGRDRIELVVAKVRGELLDMNDRAPRFGRNRPPSFAAAAAMLELVLGEWYEPVPADIEFISALLEFLTSRWQDPSIYHDYWTEFTAPLLDISEFHQALGSDLEESVDEGEHMFATFEPARRGTEYGILSAALGLEA
jgi:hypothetical protein